MNPYAMTATMRGFLMKERQSQAAALGEADETEIMITSEYTLGPTPILHYLQDIG